jgi:Lrp/AsnC family transcriptional regulator, regulator for asnA, asnC and gidA
MSSKNNAPVLDSTDRQILNILLEDATTAYADIAKRIHVSPGTVHVRMRRLQSLDIARPAFLNINYRKINYDICSFFGIFAEKANLIPQIVQQLQYIPEVTNAHLTAGTFSIFAQVICRDTAHLHKTTLKIQTIAGVQRVESFLSLEQPIHRPIYLKDDFYFEEND